MARKTPKHSPTLQCAAGRKRQVCEEAVLPNPPVHRLEEAPDSSSAGLRWDLSSVFLTGSQAMLMLLVQ